MLWVYWCLVFGSSLYLNGPVNTSEINFAATKTEQENNVTAINSSIGTAIGT